MHAEPTREDIASACNFLPLFPLPRVVLMPGALLPLHVFEPRYRALVTHCLAGNGLMGIATLQDIVEARTIGQPAIYEEIGIGRIVAHQPMPDGRSNVVVQSVGRGRLVDEYNTEHSFRLARLELAQDATLGADIQVGQLRSLVLQLGCHSEESTAEARRLASLSPSSMVDELARKLLETPEQRRAYLRLNQLGARAELVVSLLSGMLRLEGTPRFKA